MLVTTFNGILADALRAQLDLLVQDDGVRRRIEVLNVDRLAYPIVKQARGTPVIADERMLRAAGRMPPQRRADFTPAFMKNEWEQVILAQDLSTEQAYLTCLRTGRGRPLTKAQRSQVWQAAQRVTAELAAARQSTHLQLANEAAHLLRQAESAALPAHPRGRGPGPAPVPVAAAPRGRGARARTTCSSRPTRTSASTTTGSPWPACGSACGAEPAAVAELPDHPGDPGLGGAAARRRSR